jgi:hypothetical protein
MITPPPPILSSSDYSCEVPVKLLHDLFEFRLPWGLAGTMIFKAPGSSRALCEFNGRKVWLRDSDFFVRYGRHIRG